MAARFPVRITTLPTPTWKINAYAGDTFTINFSTGLKLGGVVFGCGPAGETPVVICGPELGSLADAVVDPLFEFDQQAFDAEMGTNTYSL